jgi:hypothetical protein
LAQLQPMLLPAIIFGHESAALQRLMRRPGYRSLLSSKFDL